MVTRREWLKLTASAGAAGAALSLTPGLLDGVTRGGPFTQEMMMRAIPSTGERVPVVGLGSSATFSQVARSEDYSALGEVLSALVENGGSVFDTAPSYGASEEVAGSIANDLGIRDRIFWATKVNVAARGGGGADPAAARAQIERSFERFQVSTMDCIQVHNLGDIPTQLGILKEMKAEGRVRYIGVTSTSEGQYDNLAAVMRNEPLDWIGVDYAVDNRSAAERIFPIAQDRGIAVMVYVPFGRTRLWNRVSGREVPSWAHDFDAHTWAQFFIKFCLAHPAVTVVTPATSQARHMVDNLGAGRGRLPDDETVERMVRYVEALPTA
jgi:aryl-alcohol dehydrogenase-like predicted oxidoreductase